MSIILVPTLIYKSTVYINDRTLANTPTQCAVLRRYWSCSSVGAPPATTSDFAANLDATLSADYRALINNNAEYRGLTIQRVSGGPPYELPDVSTANTGVGTGGAIAMAKQSAGLINFQTAFIGKKNRGRQYAPFPSTTHDQGNGVPTNAYMVLLANLAADLRPASYFVALGGRTGFMLPVIWNPKVPGYTAKILTDSEKQRWATQKRRGDYGRINVSPI
jgi:hypothetical protein